MSETDNLAMSEIEKENKQLLEKIFLTKLLNEKFKTDKPREGDSDKGGM